MTISNKNLSWAGKLSAAFLGGLLFIAGFIGVMGRIFHGNSSPMSLVSQSLMWASALIFATCLSACFLFRSAKHAWAFYAIANVMVWGFFALIRGFGA